MNSSASFYSTHDSADLDPEEIRRIVAKGKEMGLIKEGPRRIVSDLQHGSDTRADRVRYKPPTGPAQPIEKTGTPAIRDVPEAPPEVALAQATELPPGLNAQWLDITPAIAHRWLLNNVRNRKVDHDTVQAYARDMLNGEWQSTHQGIAFNDLDELIDGQHRLHAIIASGCTVSMLVTFGLPSVIEGKEVTPMDCVDRGRPRSVADQLKLQHGLKHGTAIAQVTMGIARLCYQKRTRRLSVGQTLDIFRAWQAPIEHVIRFRSKEPGLKAAGVLSAFAFALAADVRLKLMFDRLNSGKELVPGSAMFVLREFLVSDDAKLLNSGSDRALAELVLHAIYLERAGQHVDRLKLDPAGADYFRAQQADRVATVAALFTLPEE